MSEQVIVHDLGCTCESCRKWFMAVHERFDQNYLTGRCAMCDQPIDAHALNKQGSVTACGPLR